ncbi:hypothetical protein [Sphingosinicella ginsenosidimutans]|uniref:hypothetical protein n=1 Tax=Allosphingosinicella ginsenosidimutans TaxID=1176539 RepID=UPI00131580DE|nr:hypothetical protein [Sphingosinicella ginsenosidimutans]
MLIYKHNQQLEYMIDTFARNNELNPALAISKLRKDASLRLSNIMIIISAELTIFILFLSQIYRVNHLVMIIILGLSGIIFVSGITFKFYFLSRFYQNLRIAQVR